MGKTDSDGDGGEFKAIKALFKGDCQLLPCGKMNLLLPQYLTFHKDLEILSEIS